MAEILIRAASGGDVAAVRELMRAYGEHLAADPHGAAGICLEDYAKELEGLPNPYLVLLLATVDGTPAGCVALKAIPSTAVPEARACEMKRLWVDTRFRGTGLGRRLAEEALAWARRAGFEAMYLDTVPAAMPEANRMYAAMGFERVERYNQNPVANLVFLRKSLANFK
ncbi:GNAT family N-acetyltransferase [Edaphobacter bradus]|uniref:GNAT family N-acetyltransferase n=1 Tax=Edaphobacter bradus TaxID=2259016 RepID=UPI0021E02728|nr:GNAT family N-acetyltransferase [Edaphobacter bradus]